MHIPVLKKEVIEYLKPKPNEDFIDATIGEAGHTLAILEKNKPKGKVLGIDQSIELIEKLKLKAVNRKLQKRLILVCNNFANLKETAENYGFKSVSGILFDLGMSSWHLEESKQGFSFKKTEPLDMRYNPELTSLTAEKIINDWPEKQIEKIFKECGEERFSKRIAEKIIRARALKPIKNTLQLTETIRKATPAWYHHKKIHFATKVFQALRITVNNELENITRVLPQALEILKPEGRLVVISFHSLEDRIIKNFLREKKKQNIIEILTKKPIISEKEETQNNPRARSAKLRAAVKL